MFSWLKLYMGWIIGLSILIIICVFLIYSWTDTLVSLDYARQEAQYQRHEIKVLQKLLLEMGKRMSRSEIKRLIIKHLGEDHITEEQNQLLVDGGIILKFRGDSLVEVKSLE